MFCKYCGEDISPESSICPKCGKEIQDLRPTPEQIETMVTHDGDYPLPSDEGKKKHKGLLGPIITMLVSAAGWLYMITTNSINGIIAWFTSSSDLSSSVSSKYDYFGNNGSADELWGNIAIIVLMAVLTLIGVVGIVWLVKRLISPFTSKKK